MRASAPVMAAPPKMAAAPSGGGAKGIVPKCPPLPGKTPPAPPKIKVAAPALPAGATAAKVMSAADREEEKKAEMAAMDPDDLKRIQLAENPLY